MQKNQLNDIYGQNMKREDAQAHITPKQGKKYRKTNGLWAKLFGDPQTEQERIEYENELLHQMQRKGQ